MDVRLEIPCKLPGRLGDLTGEIQVWWVTGADSPGWRLVGRDNDNREKFLMSRADLPRFKEDLLAAIQAIRRLAEQPPNDGLFEDKVGARLGGSGDLQVTIQRRGRETYWPSFDVAFHESDIKELLQGLPALEAEVERAVTLIKQLAK